MSSYGLRFSTKSRSFNIHKVVQIYFCRILEFKLQSTPFTHRFCTNYDLVVLFPVVFSLLALTNWSLLRDLSLKKFRLGLFQRHSWDVVRITTIAHKEIIKSQVYTMNHSISITLFQSHELQNLIEVRTGRVCQILCTYRPVSVVSLGPW